MDLSDISGFLVGHIWTCRTYLAILSDISGYFVGHIWRQTNLTLSDTLNRHRPTQVLYTLCIHKWLGDVTVTTLNLRSRGCRFNSQVGLLSGGYYLDGMQSRQANHLGI